MLRVFAFWRATGSFHRNEAATSSFLSNRVCVFASRKYCRNTLLIVGRREQPQRLMPINGALRALSSGIYNSIFMPLKIVYSRWLRIRLPVLQTATNSGIHCSFEAASPPACMMSLVTREEVFLSKCECKKKKKKKKKSAEIYALAWWCHQEKQFPRYRVTLLHWHHPAIDGCVSEKLLHCRDVFRDRLTCLVPRDIGIIFLNGVLK